MASTTSWYCSEACIFVEATAFDQKLAALARGEEELERLRRDLDGYPRKRKAAGQPTDQ